MAEPVRLKLLLTKEEAAYALGISVRKLEYILASKDGLETRRIGGRVLITAASLIRFSKSDHPVI